MYIPEEFRLEDPAAAGAIIRHHGFGLLVTAPERSVTATHLPFLFDDDRGDQGTLLGHMARANPQWRDFETLEQEALVIFQGPHAYVSPTWYGHDGKAVIGRCDRQSFPVVIPRQRFYLAPEYPHKT